MLRGGLDEHWAVALPLDEQDPVVLLLDEHDSDRSSRLGVDEQDPMEGWMNRTPWRAGRTVAGGGLDEQYPMEGWLNRTP